MAAGLGKAVHSQAKGEVCREVHVEQRLSGWQLSSTCCCASICLEHGFVVTPGGAVFSCLVSYGLVCLAAANGLAFHCNSACSATRRQKSVVRFSLQLQCCVSAGTAVSAVEVKDAFWRLWDAPSCNLLCTNRLKSNAYVLYGQGLP